MTRTQLSIEKEMLLKARKRAGQLGISLAEYVRRLVANDLGGGPEPLGAVAVFNLGSSGGSDVAQDKDVMLGLALSRSAPPKGDGRPDGGKADL